MERTDTDEATLTTGEKQEEKDNQAEGSDVSKEETDENNNDGEDESKKEGETANDEKKEEDEGGSKWDQRWIVGGGAIRSNADSGNGRRAGNSSLFIDAIHCCDLKKSREPDNGRRLGIRSVRQWS